MAGPGFGNDLMEDSRCEWKLNCAFFEGGGHLVEAPGSADRSDIFPEERALCCGDLVEKTFADASKAGPLDGIEVMAYFFEGLEREVTKGVRQVSGFNFWCIIVDAILCELASKNLHGIIAGETNLWIDKVKVCEKMGVF